jgi:hypothetical protein
MMMMMMFVHFTVSLYCTAIVLAAQVLAENQATVQEYAAALGCSERVVEEMVHYDPQLVSAHRRDDILAKIKLLQDTGFTARQIIGR